MKAESFILTGALLFGVPLLAQGRPVTVTGVRGLTYGTVLPGVARIILRTDAANSGQFDLRGPNRNQVLFHLDNLDVTSRLVEGNYVDIERVIPSDWATRTVVPTAELLKAVRVASFFAKDSANILRIQVEPGADLTPGVITISANAAEGA